MIEDEEEEISEFHCLGIIKSNQDVSFWFNQSGVEAVSVPTHLVTLASTSRKFHPMPAFPNSLWKYSGYLSGIQQIMECSTFV